MYFSGTQGPKARRRRSEWARQPRPSAKSYASGDAGASRCLTETRICARHLQIKFQQFLMSHTSQFPPFLFGLAGGPLRTFGRPGTALAGDTKRHWILYLGLIVWPWANSMFFCSIIAGKTAASGSQTTTMAVEALLHLSFPRLGGENGQRS